MLSLWFGVSGSGRVAAAGLGSVHLTSDGFISFTHDKCLLVSQSCLLMSTFVTELSADPL